MESKQMSQTAIREVTIKKFKSLEEHAKRNIDTSHINYKVYHLLHKPSTFVNAYAKVSKNKGSLTKGVEEDEEVMGFFGLERARRIARRFKKNAHQWSFYRRTWIPKPGKTTKRPIDTPTQEDRIVQEAIRGILEAIYEPEFREFEKKNSMSCTNFGFRPNKSCWDAIKQIQTRAKRTTCVIEGDIKQAYNNVNHKQLLCILSRRIKDKKFLKLISEFLKTSIVEKEGQLKHSLLGTPQGGIVSPLLFNIYMFEFDKKVFQEVIEPINRKQGTSCSCKSKSRVTEKINPAYVKARNQIRVLKQRNLKRLRTKQYKKQIKLLIKKAITLPYKVIESLPKAGVYYRYADDWVVLITGDRMFAGETLQKLETVLQKDLKLELDQTKTKITQFQQGFKFLGFSIRQTSAKRSKISRVLYKRRSKRYERILTRTTSRNITIIPDRGRLLNNLIAKGFCRRANHLPIAKASWLYLTEYEIVLKFRQVILGIWNYYLECKGSRMLHQVFYILKYSCAKTLARRRKESIGHVFLKYGQNLKIPWVIYYNQKAAKTTQVELPSEKKLANRQISKTLVKSDEFDPFHILTFWRTKYKMYQECCICGETKGIAMHHLNSVRRLKTQTQKHKKNNNSFIIANQLRRLQIPVTMPSRHHKWQV